MSTGESLQEFDWYKRIVKERHVCSYYEKNEPDEYFHNFEISVKMRETVELFVYKDHSEGLYVILIHTLLCGM